MKVLMYLGLLMITTILLPVIGINKLAAPLLQIAKKLDTKIREEEV